MEKIGSNYSVTISSGTIVRGLIILLLFAFLYFIRDIVLVILTAVVIASAVEPAIKFGKRYRLGRLPSVIIVYAIIASILATIFYFFLPLLIADINQFLSSLPQYVDSLSVWNPLSDSASVGLGRAKEIAEGLSLSMPTASSSFDASLFKNIARITSALSQGGILQAASIFFGGLLSFILIVVVSFYLAVQEDGVAKFLRIITPRRNETYVLDLWRRAQEKIGLWIQGQLVLALLVSVLIYLGLTLLGVRNALLFALLGAVFETIPLFGPILAAIPAIIVSFVDRGLSGGIVTACMYVIIQQFENHLIYPLVVRKIIGVPPIIVVLAIVIGFKVAGFLGVILAVPLATVLVELLGDIEKRKALLPE
jgi:predicted PurR-regulated permease PerM